MSELRWNESEIVAAIERGAERGVARGAVVVESAAKRKVSGGTLNVRTGNLRRSITTVRRKDASGPVAMVGTGVEYAPIHEYGGVIKPKNGKYLAIPIGKTQTQSLVTKGKFLSPRNIVGLKFIKTKSGKAFLVRKTGKGKKATTEFLYALKESVRIPARPWLRPALNENRRKVEKIIAGELDKATVKFR